jgi:hypothetical protein
MGFAWRPDNKGESSGQLYRYESGTSRRYYRDAVAWAGFRGPAGRHAQKHGQRARLDDGSRNGSRSGGREAHAAVLTNVPRRPTGWSGPGRWRRWA